MTPSLYTLDGGLYRPEPIAASPWNPTLQSGTAIAPLLGALLGTVPAAAPLTTARITIDILRPVPMAPLEGRTQILRDGKRMQTLQAEILADGVPVARATSLRVHKAPSPDIPMAGGPYPPRQGSEQPLVRSDPHRNGLETRLVRGGLLPEGPGALWARAVAELTPGRPVSRLEAALMVADHGSAVSSIVDPRAWSFANMDIAVHLTREPVSEWLYMEARTLTAGNGLGLVETSIGDEEGPFAKAHQTVFFAPVTQPRASEARA